MADAVCVWVVDSARRPPGSLARYFSGRVERTKPFSPRLRRAGILAIDRVWFSELKESTLETIHLLNRLEVGVDDIVVKDRWAGLLVTAIRSPTGPESLSSHNRCLLGKLVLERVLYVDLALRDTEVMRSLEEAGDWEKLEVWMTLIWQSLRWEGVSTSGLMGDIESATLKLLSHRPQILPMFEDLCEENHCWDSGSDLETLKRVCDQARVERSSLESPHPTWYVTIRSVRRPCILM